METYHLSTKANVFLSKIFRFNVLHNLLLGEGKIRSDGEFFKHGAAMEYEMDWQGRVSHTFIWPGSGGSLHENGRCFRGQC